MNALKDFLIIESVLLIAIAFLLSAIRRPTRKSKHRQSLLIQDGKPLTIHRLNKDRR